MHCCHMTNCDQIVNKWLNSIYHSPGTARELNDPIQMVSSHIKKILIRRYSLLFNKMLPNRNRTIDFTKPLLEHYWYCWSYSLDIIFNIILKPPNWGGGLSRKFSSSTEYSFLESRKKMTNPYNHLHLAFVHNHWHGW